MHNDCIEHSISHLIYHQSIAQMMRLLSGPMKLKHKKRFNTFFPKIYGMNRASVLILESSKNAILIEPKI